VAHGDKFHRQLGRRRRLATDLRTLLGSWMMSFSKEIQFLPSSYSSPVRVERCGVNCALMSAVGAMRGAARICCSARTSPPGRIGKHGLPLRRQLQRDGLVSFALSSLSLLCCFVLLNERDDDGGGDRRDGENDEYGDGRVAQAAKPALLSHVSTGNSYLDLPWMGAVRSVTLSRNVDACGSHGASPLTSTWSGSAASATGSVSTGNAAADRSGW
jgi:hypothetical protein